MKPSLIITRLVLIQVFYTAVIGVFCWLVVVGLPINIFVALTIITLILHAVTINIELERIRS